MKHMNQVGLAFAALLLAATTQAQTTTTTPMTSPSIYDNPGVLGHSYADLNYSWTDYHRDSGIDADGYIAGLSTNVPLSRGFDFGLGYNYHRLNHHRNPFTGTPYDARYHEAMANATLFSASGRVKPFVSGGLGYQWSRGDIQRLRTYDHDWTWGASAGAEIPMGFFAFTPRVSFTDVMHSNSAGAWHYGAQLHHWFSERVGGYVDATFHDPRHSSGPEWWTYTAGLRYRF